MNAGLREALAERIDAVGPARPDLDALVERGEARLRRRRRRRTAVVGGAVGVVVAIAVGLSAGQTRDAAPKPSDRPPTPVVPTVRINEFLLTYPDPAAADRALVDAVRQLRQCPKPIGPGAYVEDHFRISRPTHVDRRNDPLDTSWSTERVKWPTSKAHGQVPSWEYAFHVARADNVLVVVEGTMSDDRGGSILADAVHTALPEYRFGVGVPGGETIARNPYMVPAFFDATVRQPGWPPTLTECVDDPRTWGADTVQGATFVKTHLEYPDLGPSMG